MNELETLEKIYEKNKKIEEYYSLVENPPIAGRVAKRLIKNCKEALKIISKYETELESDLIKNIERMEDELAKRDMIFGITYNLGARTQIHVSIMAWHDYIEPYPKNTVEVSRLE